MELYLLVGCGLALAGIVLVPLTARIGAPVLLLFLAIGMLAGVDGPGGLYFDDFDLALEIGSVALAVILFAGGLETTAAEIRKAAGPAIVLATIGVAATAAIVAGVAWWLLDFAPVLALLLGAVVASTDAAATFLLLRQSKVALRARLQETIVVESGLNDPMAIFLTVSLVTIVDAGQALSVDLVPALVPDLALRIGIGALAGIAGGWVLARIVDGIAIPEGLTMPLVLLGGLTIYAATDLVGGSAYLAVYLCGATIRARVRHSLDRIAPFHDGLAWLAQLVLFLMLGLLVTPTSLSDRIGDGLIVAAALMFAARPLAVLLCLTPFRFALRDQLFAGWVGLRGGVPIFLAIIPVVSPGPTSADFFNIVFVIVVASLVLQGWTIPAVARLLGVTEQPDRAGSQN
jgi:cell volume regulation protein A